MGIGIGAQIDIDPGLQSLIDILKQSDILRIIPAQDGPGFNISINTAAPELRACIGYLATAMKIAPDVVEFIGIEFEVLARELEGIYGFEWAAWLKPVNHKTSLDFLNIEGRSVVSDDYIGLIKHLPNISTEGRVVVFISIIERIIRKAACLDGLIAIPAYGI